ncbi:S1 RNA-binding domain-containing protein [Mesomycoplasma hyorhinis]|uniref:S1 RNA-binding domain-containing protein n=2 Tax=Mesomycoplasma hyorhinis TaxID=2100 RepID=A0ABD6IEK7_MESHY|nr:S1 RNA-binding domain-containing protein [Mesomycoplasma hyorhinis]AFX74588.1 hypothetical protein MOS_685 [Mesomycoplasma hyorhinis SK76]MXR11485.1 S1 RNA-binding domain-containing protein [Mesomycoplasma hyorhinis]MXR38643.1 S1 RNA-binding domain-containing protein [Mesomycoplasma hyorhinis]MXR43596.1 S1 RNA-binding domain-containing protein [Mesomycoplasma hyorhinis]QPC29564.1 S1 RNA-binding domain-containing protein [Mesomycoplasma hyorhinis]
MEIGQVVVCIIKEIKEKYFWTDMPEGYQGVVFVNEISNKFIKDLAATNFEIGQKVKLEILSINHTNKKASLSFKNVNTNFDIQITSTNTHKLVTKKQTQSTKKINTYVLQATLNGFDNLKKAADKEIEEKWKSISSLKKN